MILRTLRLSITLVSMLLVAGACSAGELEGTSSDAVSAVDGADGTEGADGGNPDPVAKRTLVVTGEKSEEVLQATGARQGEEQPASSDQTSSTTSSTAGPTTSDVTTEPLDTGETAPPGAGSRAFPDCSGGCNYLIEGDSITMNLAQWLWPKFCTDVGAVTCVNSGIGGNRIDQMIETARNDVDIHLGQGEDDVLIFWGGTNDLWQKHHSQDPAEGARVAYEFTKSYITERREKGWDYVIILTHPPMNPDVVAGYEQLNDLIRRNEAGADTVIDVGPDPKLANPFDPVMRSPDGVHYKDPGRQVVVEEYLIPTVLDLAG